MVPRLFQKSLVTGLLCLAPLAMTIVRRSSTLLLAATTLLLVLGNRKEFWNQWRQSRIEPALLIGLAVLIVWAVISLIWSPLPIRGAKQLVFDFMVPVACGTALLIMTQTSAPQKAALWFAISIACAAALVAAQLYSGIRIEAFFNPKENHSEAWRFNMVIVSIAMLIPALLMMMRQIPLAAACAILMVILAALMSQSATSKAMLLAGFFAFATARLLPRRLTIGLLGMALFAILLIQPWQGRLIENALHATGQYEALFPSAQERIVIWKATGTIAVQTFPWGTGMGSSDGLANLPIAKIIPDEQQFGLRHVHAHNAFLNVWLELGLPGLIAMVLMAYGTLKTLSRLSKPLFAPSIALIAQVIIVDLISHGAWQAWWFTAIMLGILALKNYAPADNQSA